MTDIIFSIDTEDFTSPFAANAIYDEAEILRKEGIKGGFCIVGLLAKQLKNWNRKDIEDALSHHIIGNHSFGHTLHPTINEYTDIADFDEAQNELLRQENESVEAINNVTNNAPIVFACPPANQKSYVAMYSYADMGIPIYADTICDTLDGQGVFYCNMFQVRYTYPMELFLDMESKEELKDVLDELATKKRVIMFTHPNMALYSQYWDAVNYRKINKHKFGEWEECKRRDEKETKKLYDYIETFIKLVKNDSRFRITNYNELAEELSQEGERIIRRSDIVGISKELDKRFFPVTSPCSLSISDIFLACRDFLLGKEEHICSKVYGFLDNPFSITEEIIISKGELIESAAQMNVERFLPCKIMVGNKVIGPADWLRAATAVINGEESVILKPGPQIPSLDILPEVRDCNFYGQWGQISDDFKDDYLSDRLRLQAWTMRFLKKSEQ